MKEIFHALQTYLLGVPGVEDVRRYNQQPQALGQESLPLSPTSVLVEFVNVRKRQRPGAPIVDTDVTLRFYVSNDELDQGEGDEIYDLVETVKGYLWNYSAQGLMLPLRLMLETPDVNASNFYTFQLEYQTTFTEALAIPDPEQTVELADLELGLELDVDNHTLNLGDNRGYSFEAPDNPVGE